MTTTKAQHLQPVPPEQYQRLTTDAARFIFEQAQSLLLDTIEVRRSVEAKANTLIATLTPTVFALFSIATGVVKIENAMRGTYIATIIAIIFLISALTLCILLISPIKRQRMGSLPGDLFKEHWGEVYGEKQILVYLMNEINSYHRRADENLGRANFQARMLRWALTMILVAPLSSGATLLFCFLFPVAN